MNRRQFIATAAVASGAAMMPMSLRAGAPDTSQQTPGSFDFIFLTDTHIQPELDAANGCAIAFRKASGLKADFVIQGGDHVLDALAADRKRADSLFDLYQHTEQAIGVKVHHTMGNHDHFALYTKSGVETGSPGYAKEMYRERVGPTYYSIDHKGYHFVILDTVQPTADRSYEARIDDDQLTWLKGDLEKLAAGTPIVVSAHVPLVSGMESYVPRNLPKPPALGPAHPQLIVSNANDAMQELQKHNTLAVFQGHIHVNEVVTYHGIHYVSSGAVSGNWWHGPFLGTPEGFTVVSLNAGKIDWRYETTGFKSVAPMSASW